MSATRRMSVESTQLAPLPHYGDAYRPALEFAAAGASRCSRIRGADLPTTSGATGRGRAGIPSHLLAGHRGTGSSECMAVARQCPNVYLELTAAYAVRGLVERMVAEVGAHKIVFGCDLPWFDPHYAIGCVVMAHISEDARRAVLRENALRLLEGRRRVR